MEAFVKTFPAEKGEQQRVQAVRLDRWEELEFCFPKPDGDAFEPICRLYRDFLVPKCPWIFPQMVLFRLPEEVETDFPDFDPRVGTLTQRQLAAAAALRRGMYIAGGKPHFRNGKIQAFWQELEKHRSVEVVGGYLPDTQVIPVGDKLGFLTRQEDLAGLWVNASFFIMDSFDCGSPYDTLGTPFGLCVRNGEVLLPPMYGREALLVHRDHRVEILPVSIEQLGLEIRGQRRFGSLYTRPERRTTPRQSGVDVVIIGRQVAAVKQGGGTVIPAGGFVLHMGKDEGICPGEAVTYRGMEDVLFGIQVGNSILVNGEKTRGFRSRFYNIRRLGTVPYPPSLYPLGFNRDRAPRIALGADAEGRPVLCWVEGAGKFGHQPGEEGCGATLEELGEICEALGMVQAVNLDGGGSAQILMDGVRTLRVSDRNRQTLAQIERAVPLALRVRPQSGNPGI